jgi:hypothetical protein
MQNNREIIEDWCKTYLAKIYEEGIEIKPENFNLCEQVESGYRVEYDHDKGQVCIIPEPFIPFNDFIELSKMYLNLGYKHWLRADSREGYLYAKVIPVEEKTLEKD